MVPDHVSSKREPKESGVYNKKENEKLQEANDDLALEKGILVFENNYLVDQQTSMENKASELEAKNSVLRFELDEAIAENVLLKNEMKRLEDENKATLSS